MKKIHYNVDGLTNENIRTQVRNAVEKIEGVDMVSVDMETGSVDVDYNRPADSETIKDNIENTGLRIDD